MKGLELSELYFREYGEPMIKELFPEASRRIAAGLAGEGSECLSFDDEVSRDHDFGPSFCLWLTNEDYDKYGFALTRAYSSLPREFMGVKRDAADPTGGARRGVFRSEDFFRKFLGSPHAPESYGHWLAIPEYSLAAAVSGKVFYDPLGEFSATREKIALGYPEDVRFKKIASALLLAHQSGVYNYPRCLAHGENGSAQLSLFTFVKNISALIYLINKRYMPFYKWVFRGMKDLSRLSDLADVLTFLIENPNDGDTAGAKKEIVADICRMISDELFSDGVLPDRTGLEEAAYLVNGKIRDASLRNENIFAGMIRE